MSAKFKLQLFMIFAVLAAAVYFFPGNKSSMPSLPKMPAKKTVYYKWQDAQGNWHMSDTAPEGVNAQRLETNPNANIIQSVEVPGKKPKTDKQPATADGQIPLEYLNRAKQTMQDAEQARDLLNQRQKELDDFVQGK